MSAITFLRKNVGYETSNGASFAPGAGTVGKEAILMNTPVARNIAPNVDGGERSGERSNSKTIKTKRGWFMGTGIHCKGGILIKISILVTVLLMLVFYVPLGQ